MRGDHLHGNRVKDSCCNECRFRKLRPFPDLNWTITELFVSGENTIIVRGEATDYIDEEEDARVIRATVD